MSDDPAANVKPIYLNRRFPITCLIWRRRDVGDPERTLSGLGRFRIAGKNFRPLARSNAQNVALSLTHAGHRDILSYPAVHKKRTFHV